MSKIFRLLFTFLFSKKVRISFWVVLLLGSIYVWNICVFGVARPPSFSLESPQVNSTKKWPPGVVPKANECVGLIFGAVIYRRMSYSESKGYEHDDKTMYKFTLYDVDREVIEEKKDSRMYKYTLRGMDEKVIEENKELQFFRHPDFLDSRPCGDLLSDMGIAVFSVEPEKLLVFDVIGSRWFWVKRNGTNYLSMESVVEKWVTEGRSLWKPLNPFFYQEQRTWYYLRHVSYYLNDTPDSSTKNSLGSFMEFGKNVVFLPIGVKGDLLEVIPGKITGHAGDKKHLITSNGGADWDDHYVVWYPRLRGYTPWRIPGKVNSVVVLRPAKNAIYVF